MSRLSRAVLFVVVLAWVLALTSCGGPDLRPQAKSQVNVVADTWDGSMSFSTSEIDPWGNPLTTKVTNGDVYYHLVVRSAGPDGLPYTQDDIVATRDKKHTAVGKAIGGFLEEVNRGRAKGTVEGIREGATGGTKEDTKKENKK